MKGRYRPRKTVVSGILLRIKRKLAKMQTTPPEGCSTIFRSTNHHSNKWDDGPIPPLASSRAISNYSPQLVSKVEFAWLILIMRSTDFVSRVEHYLLSSTAQNLATWRKRSTWNTSQHLSSHVSRRGLAPPLRPNPDWRLPSHDVPRGTLF
jgi:hypothetical protein